MPAQQLNGRTMATHGQERLQQIIAERCQKGLQAPTLAVILVGDNPASIIYVKHKRKACKMVGIESFLYELDEGCGTDEIHRLIDTCNQDKKINGILLQLPLPAQIDANALLEAIDPHKDVDGFHPYNLGRLAQGNPCLRSCTPKGVMTLLAETGENLCGKHAVIVGASNIVGRPMALELLLADCTITICHQNTADLAAHIQQADILVAAIGKPGVINSQWIKPGAIVIDVGFSRGEDGKIHGDIDEQARERAAWLTPVPGGVGPMTIFSLLENTLQAAQLQQA